MQKITKIDKDAAKVLSAEAQEALTEVAERHGLVVKIEGGKFNPEIGTFSPKVTFVLLDSERRKFAADCELAGSMTEPGLLPEDYGKSFTHDDRVFTVVGVNLRATKFPVVAEADGKRYKFPVAGVVGRIAPERKPKHVPLAVVDVP